ncbi:MAG: site-2 protease family protein [Planctomycetes bacterium]|nr:site-2 protease family protein [Planctomycetota bacterium]
MDWLSNVGSIVLVALGIGGVIFLHECGHFFAARWCGVRVECFSLGFGPKLFGWKRGPTTYQLALLPLGGYVKMAGEEGSADGRPAPDELPSKSVGQRFLIYSGGVIANVLTGLIVFPILFAYGVPFQEPVVGGVTPGGPAWNAGIETGSTIVRVNDRKITKFGDIATEVALGSPEHAEVEYLDPNGARHVVGLVPAYDEGMGAYTLGLAPGYDRQGKISVEPNSAAARAGLAEGDRLVAVESGVPGLTTLEALRLLNAESAPVKGTFEREGRSFEATIALEEDPAPAPARLGIQPVASRVVALRANPTVQALGLAKDDRLLAVNGRPIRLEHDLVRALAGAQERVRLEFLRGDEPKSAETGPLDAAAALRFARDVAVSFDTESTRVSVLAGSPAALAGVLDGDRIVQIDGAEPKAWEDVRAAIQKKKEGTLPLVVEREEAGAKRFVELTATLAPGHSRSYGFGPQAAMYVYQVSGPVEAVKEGWLASWTFLEEGWLTLKRIANRQVSGDNIGGIITIGVVSKKFADSGIVSLLFFLCMLSMNLAFLNVLPIPVLDGGHLLFLLIEKVKGSPVSEKVLGYSQMVGIVLILSLMVYVTFNDVMRWIVN